MKTLGKFRANIEYKGKKCIEEIYVIVNLQTCLLGKPALFSLRLGPNLNSICQVSAVDPNAKFPELFKGLVVMKGCYSIKLKPAIPFAITSPRRVPIPLLNQTKAELERMVEEKVITPVKPTELCAPAVIVPKSYANCFGNREKVTSVVVVGEDIDLLVIIAASTNSEKIFFLKPGRGKAEVCSNPEHCSTNKGQYFVSSCVQWLRYHICSFQAGEEEIYQCSELQQVVNIFRDENACRDDIDEAGQKVLIVLFGRKKSEETSDSLIFKRFQKSLVKNNFILVFFPPTTAAARENSLRAYLQVQHWSGFAKRLLDWCWKETKHGLFSVTTHKEPAAPALLSMISLQVRKSV
ncbi:hypothetical protein AVEN_186015-1 [Araneus ventricosus]|uniref:Uncharacterized protein n=1 Tax=Araneus ventricosus TaxID=182803 RepID=A0A4Y2J2K9_ARAVE|nr:hypothetical protein AVEN_186015-1 [Araneus ventricosus]